MQDSICQGWDLNPRYPDERVRFERNHTLQSGAVGAYNIIFILTLPGLRHLGPLGYFPILYLIFDK